MGYVRPDKPDIFLSYAHVDDEPDPAFPNRSGWVTTLIRCLEKRLAMKLGRVESYDVWRDAHLTGHVKLTPEILGRVRDSAVLLLVMSPAYLASDWCRRELAAFHEELRGNRAGKGRIFVVEFDRVDARRKVAELADLRGYRFWIEDPDTRKPETLGYPIIRDSDEEYYKRLNDLCVDVVRELESIRRGDAAFPTFATSPGPDPRPAVYLAEVTEDLDTRRDAVRRHLDQAGYLVLPEAELSRDDPETYVVSVEANLARSSVFVQLLSETPGRSIKGINASYVALQHQKAADIGKPVLQWRSRGIDTASEEIPDDHRRRLNGDTVIAADLSEFKQLVVETVKKLSTPMTVSRDLPAMADGDKLVFVDAEQADLEAAREITALLAAHGVGILPPVRGTSPEVIRTALRTRMLACDGLVLVHGNNPDWPVLQWTYFRKVKADREVAIRAVGICDLPPPDKPMKAADVLHIPTFHVINCCEGLAAEKFAAFLRAL